MSHSRYGATIPDFIRKYRKHMGWTQVEMARELGIHAQYVSNIERGVHQVPVAFISLVLPFLDEDRRRYLSDLMMEASLDRLATRVGTQAALKKRRFASQVAKVKRAAGIR